MKHLQDQMRKAVLARKVAEQEAERSCEEEEAAVGAHDCSLEARRVVQAVAQSIQQSVHGKIASVVSRCLSSIFDEPYEFKINFVQKRGRTEAELMFVRNGIEVDPMTASGGGVIDVASFALRLACLMLTRPAPRRVIVLDEPFKFLSEEHRGRVREMLLELSESMEIQFVVVTHLRELSCGRSVLVGGE